MPQPLPSDLPESFKASTRILEIQLAYSRILKMEQDASSHGDPNICEQKLVCARVLGYLILEGPSMYTSEYIAQEVNSCQDYDQSYGLGEMYVHCYIYIFRKYKDTMSLEFLPSLCPFFEAKKELVEDIFNKSGKPSYCNYKAKSQALKALVRDSFQCIVTGKYDCQSVDQSHELEQEMCNSHSLICHSKCAHILPTNDIDAKHKYPASFWTIMKCFNYEDIFEKLINDVVCALDNIMTFSYEIYILFNTLKLWFEPINGQENTYMIQATKSFILYECKANPITLTSQHPDLPLPNPIYLKIHAACCKVAHLSGITEYIEKTLDDLENIEVLSQDGSSAHILTFGLQTYIQKANLY